MFLPFMFVILLVPLTIMIMTKMARHSKNPPGPPGLPFIGNLLQLDKSKPHVYLSNLSKKYGPLAFLKHGSTPIIVISSAEMAKQVLKIHDSSFCTRPPVVGQQKLSFGGIDMAFSPYNQHWKDMRKICVQNVFSPKALVSFRPIREDEVSQMIASISKSASMSQPINISRIAMSLAVNLICRVAFGRRYEDDEHEKIRFDRLVLEAQDLMVSFYYADHFYPLPMGWIDRARGLSSRLQKVCEELDAFYEEIIVDHLNPSSRPKLHEDGKDIVDLMIGLMEDQNSSSSSLELTRDHIKALLMDLFVAGTDTVAAGVIWTMTTLALRPAIMKKTQVHIRRVIGTKGSINEDDLRSLPYLKAVVLEGLRLYPPAPLLFRTQVSNNECVLGGYKVSPRTKLVINAWAIARDPNTWKDPEEFRPERFLSSNGDVINYKASAIAGECEMMPWGGGRRGCPGMEMGTISLELALANLLYSFDWALPCTSVADPGTYIDASPGLTMHKKEALVLKATKYAT